MVRRFSVRRPPSSSPRAALRGCVVALALLAASCAGEPEDPLVRLGIPVTSGAAAGYVPDPECARCHSDLYRSFQEVGMAQSFFRPRADRMIEDFAAEPFHHQASDRYYRMHRDGESLRFERWMLDSAGEPIHRLEIEVDWVLGSGHTSRTYLFRTPDGELYLLPLAWYSQTGRWGMAPGFDHAGHAGVQRRVQQECLFCHNAYPEVPAASDAYGQPHVFPAQLPEGIGCQRCHGPGAEHVRAALDDGGADPRATIVNPGDLPAERAMDICYGCHFQPSVALAGVRRFGRTNYSFRPGEPLSDYLMRIDVEEEGRRREDRFEINHHPYRLEQSACFRRSPAGELTCLSCHDPHRKVPAAERGEHYRAVCLSCHEADACSLAAMGDTEGLEAAGLGDVPADDCVACHLPRRRTQDVIEVVMTDHRIQRGPPEADRLAPLPETVPILVDALPVEPVAGVDPALEKIYLASAVTRAGGNAQATDFLYRALPALENPSPEPVLDLIRGLLQQRRLDDVEAVASQALARWPDLTRARDWRAVARVRSGRYEEALEDLRAVLAASGERAEPLFNQGLVLIALGRHREAADSLEEAVALRPNFPQAWVYLGKTLEQLGRPEEAERAFRQALDYTPADARVILELDEYLQRQGRGEVR